RFIGRTITGAHDEIKAVTYHGAKVERLADGNWSATILMDI
ncbi:MAG: archease, partial [Chlorobiaceae bacterium]|nr:archease [Chlorobiaceae bacterium]